MDKELKPCPFCGSTDLKYTHELYRMVICFNCGTHGPDGLQGKGAFATKEAAIAAWNKRVEAP